MTFSFYGGSFGAFLIRDDRPIHSPIPVTLIARTDAEALHAVQVMCERTFPSEKGWYGHYQTIKRAEDDQVQEFIEQATDQIREEHTRWLYA